MRSPVSTPAGTFTESFLERRTRPCPRQVSQGFLMTVPFPRHRGQVCWSWKNPWEMRTWPDPPQVSQAAAVLPVVLTPIVPCVLTLAYYDLRVRREGFDLQLLSDQLG